jgi:hypothetical protein
MAGPAPDLVFEVFGLEAWEFAIGQEDRTKLLFAMRDTRNFVAWYFFSELLAGALSGPFDAAALMGRKYDKSEQIGGQGLSGSSVKPRDPIRVDQFATRTRRAMIVGAKRTGDDLAFRLKLRRTDESVFFLDLIFDATGFDPPADLLFPMFGSVVMVGEAVRHKGPLIKLPQGFDAARAP